MLIIFVSFTVKRQLMATSYGEYITYPEINELWIGKCMLIIMTPLKLFLIVTYSSGDIKNVFNINCLK